MQVAPQYVQPVLLKDETAVDTQSVVDVAVCSYASTSGKQMFVRRVQDMKRAELACERLVCSRCCCRYFLKAAVARRQCGHGLLTRRGRVSAIEASVADEKLVKARFRCSIKCRRVLASVELPGRCARHRSLVFSRRASLPVTPSRGRGYDLHSAGRDVAGSIEVAECGSGRF